MSFLESGLAIWVWDRALWVTVVRLVLGTSPVIDVVEVALHDAVDSVGTSVLVVVLCVTSQLPLFAFVMTLIDVTAGVAVSPILVKVGAEVVVLRVVRSSLVGVVLVDLLLNGGEFTVCRSIRSAARMPT
jgi:hypothetical protein